MSTETPATLYLRARGDLACFSRPEASVERMSYPWPTPSAARALFEAILWKPRIRYEVREIHILKPINFTAFRRNEIGNQISTSGLSYESYMDTGENRQQRMTTALKDVDYLIKAELFLNPDAPKSGPDDNHGKYRDMFQRRLQKGQQFHQPYLGCREFAADVFPPEGNEQPLPFSMDQGLMFYDFIFPTKKNDHREWVKGGKAQPLYFHANMVNGIVHVPTRETVLVENRLVRS